MLVVPSAASAVSVTQTVDFPQIDGFGDFSEQTLLPNLWSGGDFPFTDASEIESIRLSFSTMDIDFNVGPGPTGGDPGVEMGIMLEETGTGRKGLVSAIPGNQDVLFYSYGDSQHRFETLVAEILDAELILSLGAYENFPGQFSRPFILDEASSVVVTVTGTIIPEPSTITLLSMGLVLFCAGSRLPERHS
jgi:hypothetical protein